MSQDAWSSAGSRHDHDDTSDRLYSTDQLAVYSPAHRDSSAPVEEDAPSRPTAAPLGPPPSYTPPTPPPAGPPPGYAPEPAHVGEAPTEVAGEGEVRRFMTATD